MTQDNGVSYQRALEVQEMYADEMLDNTEVVGIGVGKLDSGEYCIRLHVLRQKSKKAANLPDELEGVPIKIIVIGRIVAG